MKQEEEWKTPVQLTGQRKEAYKKIMGITAYESRPLSTAFDLLSSVYQTKSSKKKCLAFFDENPEIPLVIEDNQVVNKA